MTRALTALCAQAAIAAVVFWPLPLRVANSVAGGGFNWVIDVPLLQFVLAWESRALVVDPAHLFDAPMYAPASHAALYGPTGLGLLPLFAPVFLATGNATVALNVAFLASLVLTAWTVHLVVERWTGSPAAALVAGAALLTTEWISRGWVPSAPSYAALWWFPLIIARAARPIGGIADWAVLALFTWLQCLTDVVYVAPAVLGPLALIGVVRASRRATRRQGLALVGVVVAAATALLPLVAAHEAVRAVNPDLPAQTTWVVRLPEGLPSGLFTRGAIALEPIAWVFLAVGAGVAVWRSFVDRSPVATAAWGTVLSWWTIGVAMSIGPAFFWFDTVVENPPVAWLHRVVPAVGALRAPDRLRVATLMSSVLGVGLGVATCISGASAVARRYGWPARRVSTGVAALALAGLFATVPRRLAYPVQPMEPPRRDLVDAFRGRSGAVVEVPAPPADTLIHTRAMLHALAHRRPTLNGYSGYWPAGFPERMALAGLLPDHEALRRLRAETGLETIVLHRYRQSSDATARWGAELADPHSPFRLRWQDRSLMVVDVVDPDPPS